MNRDLSLYIHIPFCRRKCLYCDFLSFNAKKQEMDSYFSALFDEIKRVSNTYKEYRVRSIFFGGGTPSYPDSDNIVSALDLIKELFDVAGDAEISIEANPASAMYEKLISYKNAGFNRLSIGAQSLNDEELKRLGRLHDSRTFFETYENARKAGFDNINIDVMSALPGQKISDYMDTLKKVVSLKPEHISAYSLIIEEGTPFYDMELDLPEEEEDREMYHQTRRFLQENGYHRYEISNYAKDGRGAGHVSAVKPSNYECYHNKVYWKRGNYLGLGLGAASMVENTRWTNTRDMEKYLSASCEDKREEIEKLTKQSQMEEFMFLGLRLIEGVLVSSFEKEFKVKMRDIYGEVIDKYVDLGLLEEGENLRLTERGLDVSNTVMAEFLL